MGSVAPFLERGRKEFDKRVRDVEAALGRGLVEVARTGLPLSPSAVMGALSARMLEREGARTNTVRSATRRSVAPASKDVAASTPPKRSVAVAGGGRGQQTLIADKVLLPVGKLAWEFATRRDPKAKAVAGYLTRETVRPFGAVRGLWNTAKDAVEMAPMLNLAVAPIPTLIGPQRDKALRQATSVILPIADYIETRHADPSRIGDDIQTGFHNWRAGIDPTATPQAATVAGEIFRNAPIALNQGEQGLDLLTYLYGAGEANTLIKVGRLGKMTYPERVAKYVADGHRLPVAEELALPYVGQGHHAGFPQRFRILGEELPAEIMDSPWNVLKPKGWDKGQFYELHYGVDPHFYGARLPARTGQRGLSGKKSGWERYDEFGRFWNGRPILVRKTGLGAAGAMALDDVINLSDLQVNGEDVAWGE